MDYNELCRDIIQVFMGALIFVNVTVLFFMGVVTYMLRERK